MASYIASLKDDLANGFSKRDLEVLIGLPKNSLASILTNKRTLSLKSQLKIKRWNESEKPDPLELSFEKKVEKVLDNNKSEIDKVVNDSAELGVSIYKTTDNGIKHVDPLSDEGDMVMQIADQIKAIRAEKIPEHRNTRIGRISWNDEQQKRISELQAKLNP